MLDIMLFKEIIESMDGSQSQHKQYTFYYDETNNYKKVRIKENGLNVSDAFEKNYVLGGVVCLNTEKQTVNNSINELFDKKLLKYKNGEIKGSKLFKECKNLGECLNKVQVNEILKWIMRNGFIHYSTMNCFYYAIVDLVDSMWVEKDPLPLPKEYIDIMKSEIYNLINYFYRDEFIELANKINYPNVENEDIKVLCDWLIEKIDSVNGREDFELESFRQLVKCKRNASELVFLKDNEDKTVVENFYELRQQRCIIFHNSEHIFDEESTDEKFMIQNPLTKDGITPFVNYTFENSKKYRLIQISDVIVSLIGRFLDYIDNNFIETIKKDIQSFNLLQKENLKLLISLIKKSNNEDKFFIVSINSMDFNISRCNIIDYIEMLLYKD